MKKTRERESDEKKQGCVNKCVEPRRKRVHWTNTNEL